MTLILTSSLLDTIQHHGEECYPEEGAGVILGTEASERRSASQILPLTNSFTPTERSRRYQISPQDMLDAELMAEEMGLEILGIFHSHPDHPDTPSEFDQEWALPWYTYVITSIVHGSRASSRAWRLSDDRNQFYEEEIVILEISPEEEGG